MENTTKPQPRQWTNFCFRHGAHFQSSSAVDIVCPSCSAFGFNLGSMFGTDAFSHFANSKKK